MTSQPMDERRLLAILREEEADASTYYQSDLAQAQTEAMERYFGEPYGNEIEGHPAVVSQDVADTINWMMPALMRMFLTDDLIAVESPNNAANDQEQEIADYLQHVFRRDNDGDSVLHDFLFDGLLTRVGVVHVGYEEPHAQTPKIYQKVTGARVEEFIKSPEYEILEAEENEPDEFGVITYDVKTQRTPACGRILVESVAPEEFAIATRSKSIDDADYVRRKQEVYTADLARMFPDSADELAAVSGAAIDDQVDDLDSDARRQTRFEDENIEFDSTETGPERSKSDLLTEWVRIDYDGDGIVELRQIKRVGNTILENVQVDKCGLIEWSPIRISHRAIGQSVADQILELTKIRTDLMRFLLLNLEQTLSPRTFVGGGQDEDVIDQLLDRSVGDVIQITGSPRDVVFESVTPDVSGAIYPALQYTDQRTEQASGVMRHAQGHRDQGVTDTAAGIRQLSAAANSRIELIGRWAAKGVERIFQHILEQVASYQDQPRIIRVNGKPLEINPQAWAEDLTVKIHVGVAAETREERLQKLSMIASKQEQIYQYLGSGNPVVGLSEYVQTLQDIAREGGFKNPERFFKSIPPGMDEQLAQQQQDPKTAEAAAKMQLEQQKAMADAELAQAKLQFETQARAMEMQFKENMAARQAETDQALQQMKLQNDLALQQAKLASEREIAELRLQSEREIAELRMMQERELAEQRASDEMSLAAMNGSADGFRPGGELHK